MNKPEKAPTFFRMLTELLSLRFSVLKWRAVCEILLDISIGLLFGFGVTTMQWLFDAVGAVVQNPALGYGGIIRAFAMVGGVVITEKLLNNVMGYLFNTNMRIFDAHILDRMNRKAQNIEPIAYEDTKRLEDIEKAKQAIGWPLMSFTSGFIGLFTFHLPFFIYLSWYLCSYRPLLMLIFVLAFVPITFEQIIRTKVLSELANTAAPIRRAYEHYENTLCGREFVKETRQLGAFGFFFRRYQDTLDLLNRVTWKTQRRAKGIDLAFRFVIMAGYIGIVILLVMSLKDGFLTVGVFAAVFAAIDRLYDTIYNLVQYGYFANVAENIQYIKSLFAFWNLPERKGTDLPQTGSHAIALTNVGFSYPGRDDRAVADVTLTVKPGEVVALVGENGAGKSTLVRLMTGLYTPTEGTVTINDHDTKTTPFHSLFGGVSGVFQRFLRYKLTTRENLMIGDIQKESTDTALAAHAKDAGVEIESESFPQGLDTMLSREFEGTDLSGGQWQRLAIARGLYRTHDFIVLDEPTAAIDPIEETYLYKRFMELSQGKTAILVTHRLGSAKIADRILVMENGRIAEEGKHESLLAKNGLYAAMYEAQAQWYATDAAE